MPYQRHEAVVGVHSRLSRGRIDLRFSDAPRFFTLDIKAAKQLVFSVVRGSVEVTFANPHPLKKITAHNTQIYMLDTQIISIFALARWHQFGFTEQVAFFTYH